MIALFDEMNSGECERASPALARAKFFEQMLAKGKKNGYSRVAEYLFVAGRGQEWPGNTPVSVLTDNARCNWFQLMLTARRQGKRLFCDC
jgi:hypothetical protein